MEKPEVLTDICLRGGRKEAGQLSRGPNPWVTQRTRAKVFIGHTAELFIARMDEAQKKVPTIEDLPPFEREFWEASIDMPRLLKSMGQFRVASKIAKKIRLGAYRVIGKLTKDKMPELKKAERHFVGRFASLVKSLDASLDYYNHVRRTTGEFPSIDTETPTFLLAGIPNAGKSTLMKRLTGANVGIASYPFTTQSLNVAYFDYRYLRMQVIDTPGLLDRHESDRNPIEKKAISALRHLPGCLLFVVDPTQKGEQSLPNQRQLLDEILQTLHPSIVKIILNKLDACSPEEEAESRDLFAIDFDSREGDACEWKEGLAREIVSRQKQVEQTKPAT
jgi:nucleolar GTP-binding protein